MFLTNNFALPAFTIAKLYKCRWQVELFFKWIKQHLRSRHSSATENAVKTQIWIAVSVYVLVAIVKKRLGIQASLYEMLQILSLTLFEKTQLLGLFVDIPSENSDPIANNQLNLFITCMTSISMSGWRWRCTTATSCAPWRPASPGSR